MDIRQAETILTQLTAVSAPDLADLKDDLIAAAVRYARIRTDWEWMDREQRAAKDPERTAAHNAFIDSCNILSRNMARQGLDIRWREQLGDDRRIIGDFACCLHAVIGIKNR